MDEEGQREYEKKIYMAEKKRFRKDHNEVMEELAPRPSTSHESKVEKSKVRAQQKNEHENEDGLEVKEYDDGGDTFQTLLRRQQERKQRALEEKREKVTERWEQHIAKEEKTMAMLKQLAASQGYL